MRFNLINAKALKHHGMMDGYLDKISEDLKSHILNKRSQLHLGNYEWFKRMNLDEQTILLSHIMDAGYSVKKSTTNSYIDLECI